MSAETPGVEEQVYDQLAARARKHFGESILSAIVHINDYDPNKETHDFNNVFFEAQPNSFSLSLLKGLATGVSGKGPRTVRRQLVEPFEPVVDEAVERLEERKLMIVSGHQILFEPAWAAFGLQRAIASRTGRPYQEQVRATHLIAARALATADVLNKWTLTRVAQHLANIYYSFPSSDNYRGDSSIPLEFQRANNARMLDVFAERTDAPGNIGVVAGSGTTEKFDKQRGKFVIPGIKGDENRGTMGVLMQGWDVLPVGGVYRKNLIVEPGRIIPAEDVTPEVIHAAMESVVAASRNRHGVPAVYAKA